MTRVCIAVGVLAIAGAGCQTASPVTNRRLIEHQALIDFSGLKPAETVDAVQATCAIPHNWTALELKKGALYSHQQWKSPSTTSGAGIVHVRLPLPLTEKSILWLAKREYTKKSADGREIRQWTDEVGRAWFEAENKHYHVQGYVLARGFNAWLVYFGYKTGYPPDLAELSIAARFAETVVPSSDKKPRPAKLASGTIPPAAASVE